MAFLRERTSVLCAIQTLSSQGIVERLVSRDLDIGLVSAPIASPYVMLEPLMEHPLVCIMPVGHVLSDKKQIEPNDLRGMPFVSFDASSYTGARVREVFETYGVTAKIVLVAGGAPTICEFVAAGLGISLVHPLMASGLEDRVVVRPFEPQVLYKFQIARRAGSRNARLVETFAQKLRDTAGEVSRAILEK